MLHQLFCGLNSWTRLSVVALSAMALACAPKEEPAETPAEPTPEARLAPENAGAADTASAHDQTSPAVSGRVVHLDPQGNRLESMPPSLPGRASLNRSVEGLKAEDSPVPGGGKIVRLDGRFQTFSVATVQEDGSVKVECKTDCTLHDHSADEPQPAEEARKP